MYKYMYILVLVITDCMNAYASETIPTRATKFGNNNHMYGSVLK